MLSGRSAVLGELLLRRVHFPTVLCLFERSARLFLRAFSQRRIGQRFFLSQACPPPTFRPETDRRRPHRGTPHRRAQSPAFHAAHWVRSVGEDVFVVGHGIHVVARLAGPRPLRVRRGAGRGQRRRAVPLAQVAEDFFDDEALVNDRDDAHLLPALWADQRIGMPHLQDQVAPLFGGQFGGRWRRAGRAQGRRGRAAVLGAVALAAHLVGIPAVVAEHLRAFVRDVLGDGGQEISGGEDFEVAVDFGIELGAVDDGVGGGFQRHFCHGEGVSQDVLGEFFELGLVLGRNRLTGVDVEAGVFPGVENLDAFGREEF